MFSYKKLFALLLILTLAVASAAFAAPDTRAFAPVQDGFTTNATEVVPFVQGRVLVKFSESVMMDKALNAIPLQKGARMPGARTGIASVDAIAAQAGVSVIERPYITPRNSDKAQAVGTDRWFMMTVAEGDMVELANRLAKDPSVELATPDWIAFPAATPNDPLYEDHWGHNNTAQMDSYDWATNTHTGPTVGLVGFDSNAEAAWNTTYGDPSVIVAIIDSGVDIYHADLNCMAGYDFGNNDTNPMDDSRTAGHGTCCAGVTAAVANNGTGIVGIAGNCTIMPLKVADRRGSMSFVSITNALYYAADNGADVISMSLGAAISTDAATDAAILYAHNAGCTILAATGNENNSVISYPAINEYVIGVGAASPCGDRKRSSSSSLEVNPGVFTDPNGYSCDGERWWGSNYGPASQDDRGAVDIIAPTIVPTTDISGSAGYDAGDYDMYFNGTSCATPYAAGVCALIKSAFPSYTPDQVRAQLVGTAQDIVSVESGAGWDKYTGYGMVDAAAAVGGGSPVTYPPVAAFTGTPTSGDYPLNVSFTDQSTNTPTSWYWTFGDGGTSTAQNPSHTYTTAGTYSVTLDVSNADGSDDLTKSGYIVVTEPPAPEPPVAAFAGTPTSGDYPLNVTFTDQSTNDPTGWSWTFGDGGTSTAQNPTHTYTAAGTYSVTLTASNAYGSDAETKSGYISVSEPPVAGTMHVDDIYVYLVQSGRKYYGRADITILDDGGSPVSGATVTAVYTGDVSGTLSGVTGTDGKVTLSITKKVYGTLDYCFEVTNVTHASNTYNAAANVMTKACEGGVVVFDNQRLANTVTLSQNSPNPFNPKTDISFSLPNEGSVRLAIYNVKGELVKTLTEGTYGPGLHTFGWDAADHPSGVYFYRLEAPGFTETKKMIMLK